MISRTEQRFRLGDRDLAVMKLGTFIILLIFVSGPAFAQEMAARESASVKNNEQAVAPRLQADRYPQIPSAASADRSVIKGNALAARLKFMADTDLYSKTRPTDRSEAGIIENWRDQVFETFGTYISPRQSDLVNDSRLQNNNEFEEQANANRMAARIVLKETLQFTRERLPELDKLIKALRFEVSTDMISSAKADEETHDKRIGEARASHTTIVKDRLFVKTGLLVPVESGKLVVVSETEARYGKMTSFFKIYLDGRYDNNVGLKYVLGKDIHLQVERQVAHTTDLIMSDTANVKSSLDLVQLVCKF
jgi:hypothetical protein